MCLYIGSVCIPTVGLSGGMRHQHTEGGHKTHFTFHLQCYWAKGMLERQEQLLYKGRLQEASLHTCTYKKSSHRHDHIH